MTYPADPMSEALSSLGVAPKTPPVTQPYRTRKGAIKFQPDSDWSLDRLPEIESEYQQTTGTRLPVSVRGQGAIHNRWGYDHRDSADVGLSPQSKEGQILMSQLEQRGIPYLAFDRAIPGVSTGQHIHIGRPSHRLGQTSQFVNSSATPQTPDDDDPMAQAINSLRSPQQPKPQLPRPQVPAKRITFSGSGRAFGEPATPEQQAQVRAGVADYERGQTDAIRAGVQDFENRDKIRIGGEKGRLLQQLGQQRTIDQSQRDQEQAIREEVVKERAAMRMPRATLGGMKELITNPHRLFQSEETNVNEEVADRLRQQQVATNPEVTSIRQEYGAMPAAVRAPLSSVIGVGAGGMLENIGGLANLGGMLPKGVIPPLDRLHDWAKKRGEIIGAGAALPPLQTNQNLSSLVSGQPDLKEVERGIPEKVLKGVTDLGVGIGEIILLKKATNLSFPQLLASEAALKNSDQPIGRQAAAATQGYALGRALDSHLSKTANAVLFGAPTAVQTGYEVSQGRMSPLDAAIQTGIQTGAGALLTPGRESPVTARLRDIAPTAAEAAPPRIGFRERMAQRFGQGTDETQPPVAGTVRFYRADAADAKGPQGAGWSTDPNYVSGKYGAGQMGGRESVWYIDVPRDALESEFGDVPSIINNQSLDAMGVKPEPQLYRRSTSAPARAAVGETTPEAGTGPGTEPEVSPLEDAIATLSGQRDRVSTLERELAQWQRAGGKSKRGQQRIAQIEQQLADARRPVEQADQEAITRADREQQAAIEATRYSPTPRFDEFVENETGQRFETVSPDDLTDLRERYRQEFANEPAPPALREMPPLEAPLQRFNYRGRLVTVEPDQSRATKGRVFVADAENPEQKRYALQSELQPAGESTTAQPSQPAEPPSTAHEALRDALSKYNDSGEFSFDDVIRTIDRVAPTSTDPDIQALTKLTNEWRELERESREEHGMRWDAGDVLEQPILDELYKITGRTEAPRQAAQPAEPSTGEGVDVSPILRAGTVKEVYSQGGTLLMAARSNEELAQIQKAIQQRAQEIESGGASASVEPRAETAPLKTPGQKIKVMNVDAEVLDAQRLDGVDYELYKTPQGGAAIRIYDTDAGENVSAKKYPKISDAIREYGDAVRLNGGDLRALRDRLPAHLVNSLPSEKQAAAKALPDIEPVTVGRESKAITERGSEVMTRYAIVDLNDLTTSHDTDLRRNPEFPSELQPRERERAASAEQISRIASQLRPEFLGESPKASEGAPIVGQDGIVESGNGRILGIRKAYEANSQKIKDYQRFLRSNADRFGIDPNALDDVKQPVLVRLRTSEVNRAQFVKEANEQTVAAMSPVEQARSDAKALRGPLLDLFNPSEAGDIATSGNMEFIRAFMRDVIGPSEQGRYMTASGHISQEGINRIRNAIFARAYGESPEGLSALEKLAESPDNNVRNITTAMLRNASGFASLREGIDQGVRYPLDMAPDIAAAMRKMSSLRDQGMPVGDYLRQGALYGEDLSPIQKRLLQVFDENKRGANTIDSILKNYLRGANGAGTPTQGGLFGVETPDKASLLESAILEATNARAVPPSLFEAQDKGLSSEPPPRGDLSQANKRSGTERSRATASAAAERTGSELQAKNEENISPRLQANTESEGRPLKRFDSAIERLTAQEQAARQRLADRAEEFKKLKEEKGGELGASTIPEDLYDFVVIGAAKLARKSLNAAQFVDEMVREFGETIREHARQIFKLSQRMVADTQQEIRAERLSKEIADRIFADNVPKVLQRKALKIAARFRVNTDSQGKWTSQFKSRVGEMARSYGAAGGELTNRVHLGDIMRGHLMEEGNVYLSRIQDVFKKTKNDFERMRISDAVIRALEDRGNAQKYLDTPEKEAVYKDTKELLDRFRKKLNALGYETRDDYFTHIRDVDILDQIISDAKDPKEQKGLNELVVAKSRFLQPRDRAKVEIKRDLPQVLFAYLKSVTKEIAYNDAVSYYYDHFVDDIPIGLQRNSMDRAINLMQNSLKPEQGRGLFYRSVGRLRAEQYRNFLAFNLKAAAQNFTQVDFARMRWTPEARRLSGEMWRNRKSLTGPLADAIDIASTEQTPLMRFLEQFKPEEPSGTRGRLSKFVDKYDPFQKSEKRNWALTELGSIINSVVKRPEYKTLKAQLGPEKAINKLLERQDVFDAAVREASTTAAETQVASNPAMRGEFYDAPLHRIIGMFTAFKTRQLQILAEALQKHEGINGARAQTILRRGLTGDAQPVEVLREVEAQRTAMEKMIRQARKFNEDLGIPREALEKMVQHLRSQESELNAIIKRIEPLSGGRAQSALLVSKYFAKVAAISVFFNVLWGVVYDAIAGPEKDQDAEERASTALQKAFWDVLPTPFYGADPSKFLVSPVAPNFERSSAFGHITKRGLTRDIVSYGTSVIPFAGIVDRATNRKLSSAFVDLVAPKKEKEKKIVFP